MSKFSVGDTSDDHWQHQAFADTVFLATTHRMPLNPGSPLGLAHLIDMRIRGQSFSGAKLGRWLGWAQCAVVAADIGLTLEDMQAINRRAAAGGSSLHVATDIAHGYVDADGLDHRCECGESSQHHDLGNQP